MAVGLRRLVKKPRKVERIVAEVAAWQLILIDFSSLICLILVRVARAHSRNEGKGDSKGERRLTWYC